MFSNAFRLLAAAAAFGGSWAIAYADPLMPSDSASFAPNAGMYASVQAPQSARLYRLIDRREIDTMPDLVDSLLKTISGMSGYAKPSAAPLVTKVSRGEIERTICSGPCPVKAWHMPGEGIFMDDRLTPETDLVHRSILLHELVHYLQEINGAGASMDECDRWLYREREAYRLQNQYLGLVGNSTSYHLMVANESWIASNRSTCEIWRRGVHTAQ